MILVGKSGGTATQMPLTERLTTLSYVPTVVKSSLLTATRPGSIAAMSVTSRIGLGIKIIITFTTQINTRKNIVKRIAIIMCLWYN